ncbi:hypothetical protein [Enterococcus sp. AZ126]|uniref:hypothetical protein n=1 Tax=Enterococcus sp. AZ126 TaxID=2774635 RepID=UPI003F28D69A
MKKILHVVFLVAIFSFFPIHTVLAAGNEDSNDLVIQIKPDDDKTIDKEIVGKPTPKFPNTSGPKTGTLPHLGQMITSFILLLSGIACLIVFCGVISFKKIYYSI